MKLTGLWKEGLLQLFSYFDSVYVESHICVIHSSTYREPGEFDLIISSCLPMPGCLTLAITVFSMSMIHIQGHFLGPSLFQSEIERGIQLFICNMQQLWSSFPEASVTMATCNSGRIETGCRMPSSGANFQPAMAQEMLMRSLHSLRQLRSHVESQTLLIHNFSSFKYSNGWNSDFWICPRLPYRGK